MESNQSQNKAYILDHSEVKYFTPFPVVSEPRKILFADHFVSN